MPRRCLLVLALLLLVPRETPAQSAARPFSIFLDCSDFYCESDFYRTTLTFVDHVRDRTAADVHVLITRQSTGGGGNAFTLAFYGQRRFAGMSDTLALNTPQGTTEDEQRRAIAKTVALGLARYLARTPDAARAELTVATPAEGTATAAPAHDPWDAWVFRVGVNLNGYREVGYIQDYIYGSVSASRVTDAWKTNLRVNENYNGQVYQYGEDTTVAIRRDYGGSVQQVKSLTEHWSAGLRAGASSSTFRNLKLSASVAPAVEFDLYPYKESTRRQLTLQYAVGVKHLRYIDTTVYFRTVETRPFESVNVGLERKETWGSINFEIDGYHFLDNVRQNRLSFSGGADVRLIKGLSVDFFGNYALIHDQIYLPKGDLTPADVLLRQSQLATGYQAFFYAGISYTFGSVLNNVVNPRFKRGGNEE